MYILRLARAAHNVAHFGEVCEFDEAKFSDRMKVRLYNTKRNREWREKERKRAAAFAPSSADVDEAAPASVGRGTDDVTVNVPTPTEPGNRTQEHIAADLVAKTLNSATKAGASFSCNVRLIRSAVFRRDPAGQNKPLQNALRSLMKGVRANDVHGTEEALKVLQEDVDLGVNM